MPGFPFRDHIAVVNPPTNDSLTEKRKPPNVQIMVRYTSCADGRIRSFGSSAAVGEFLARVVPHISDGPRALEVLG